MIKQKYQKWFRKQSFILMAVVLAVFFISTNIFLPPQQVEASDDSHSVSFLSASIGGSVWDDWGGNLEALLEQDGISPNTRFWNGREGVEYMFWRDHYDNFTNASKWQTITTLDCPSCEHDVIMFKVCVGPCLYWWPTHTSSAYAALEDIADFVDQHPEKFFIPWSCLPNCDIAYDAAGNPLLPWVTADLNEWMKDTFNPKDNAAVFDAWSILADANGLLKAEYQENVSPCNFHPNQAGQVALANALRQFIQDEVVEGWGGGGGGEEGEAKLINSSESVILEYEVEADNTLKGFWGEPNVSSLEADNAQVYVFVDGYGVLTEPVTFNSDGNTLPLFPAAEKFTIYISNSSNQYWANVFYDWTLEGGASVVDTWFQRQPSTDGLGSLTDQESAIEIDYQIVGDNLLGFFGSPQASELASQNAQVYVFVDGYGVLTEPVTFNSDGNTLPLLPITEKFTIYLATETDQYWADLWYPWVLDNDLSITDGWLSRQASGTMDSSLNDTGSELEISYQTSNDKLLGFFGQPSVSELENNNAQIRLFIDGYGFISHADFSSSGNTLTLPEYTERFSLFVEDQSQQYWLDLSWPWDLAGGLTNTSGWLERENSQPPAGACDQGCAYLDAGGLSDLLTSQEAFFDVADIPGYDGMWPVYYAIDWGNGPILTYYEKKDLSTPDPEFGYENWVEGAADGPAAWNYPDYDTGEWIKSRVIKFNMAGRILVQAAEFSLTDDLYLTIRYKDDLYNQLAPSGSGAAETPGAPVEIHSGDGTTYNLLGYLGGQGDHQWKTAKFTIPAGQWGKVVKDDEEYIAVRLGQFPYQRFTVGSLPIDKFMISTDPTSDQGLIADNNKAGYWSNTASTSNFSNLYQDRVYNLASGQSFFPYGIYLMYTDAPKTAVWDKMVAAKMNTVVDYKWSGSYDSLIDILDTAQANNIKVMMWEPKTFWMSGYHLHDVPASAVSVYDFLKKYVWGSADSPVRKYQDHPAVLAWYGVDELDNDSDTKNHEFAREFYDQIKATDPNHPTVVVEMGYHFEPSYLVLDQGYGEVVDIVAIDSYITNGGNNNFPLSVRLAEQALKAKKFREYQENYASNPKLLLFVPYGPIVGGEEINYEGNPPCSNSDNVVCGEVIKTQAYNVIVQGVKGLLYFTRGVDPSDSNILQVWQEGFEPLGQELFGSENLAEIILAPGEEQYLGVPGTEISVRHYGIELATVTYWYKNIISGPYAGEYLIAVNMNATDQTVTLQVPNLTPDKEITRWFDSDVAPLAGDGSLTDTIPAYGRRVYKIE